MVVYYLGGYVMNIHNVGVYEGERNEKGQRHGYGIMTYPNGQRDEGIWKKDECIEKKITWTEDE